MTGNAPGGDSGVHFTEDMRAMDRLPRLTKRALWVAVFPWSAKKVLERFRYYGWSLSDPEADRKMAHELTEIDSRRAAATREEDC